VTPAGRFACEALDATNAPALAELFERVGSGCYCSYWHFEGNTNAWLARLAFEPAMNRSELRERARTARRGVVARLPDGAVVGWMKLEPAANLPKLYAQRVYRGLPGLGPARDGVWAVGCFLVHPDWRRQGVARGLLRAGIELGRAGGARALEAFPRRAEGVRDEELFTGPLALFASEGFYVVHEQAQYPVLRRDLHDLP
jgi:GNAT superfamily N-acetyltransferase